MSKRKNGPRYKYERESDDEDTRDDPSINYKKALQSEKRSHHGSCSNYNDDDAKSDDTDGICDYEYFKSILDEVYFTEFDQIQVGDQQYTEFWTFLKKYQRFKRSKERAKSKSRCENSAEDGIKYDAKDKNNLMFSQSSDKIKKFHVKQEYRGKSKQLNGEQLKEFENILMHYFDFIQKQKFTKLRKIKQDQMNLPIYKYKEGIVEYIKRHQVIVVAGDTGCGKSTQVPQYLLEGGFTKIACTQPRRIACISLAKRVSYETLNEYGSQVAYQVRFDRTRTKSTRIVFLTEGLLLRQVENDPTLSMYDVIIMDEVHERHVHTDFLLGVVKCVLHQRPTLKLLLMSATINLELFSRYFNNAPVAKVPGRLFPIQLHYMPPDRTDKDSKSEKIDVAPYIKILQLIDRKYPPTESKKELGDQKFMETCMATVNRKGDVLVFLSGMLEIMTVVEAMVEYAKVSSAWIILPLHSSLSLVDQDKVFDYPPDGVRKCIVSTNIAETSVTIDGVRFVVDSGKVKTLAHDSDLKLGRLKEAWISRASAEQRKGRAGRTGPGVCYRLFDQSDYDKMEEYSTPEIGRVPLQSLVLQMVALGIPDPRVFPFIEAPPLERLENSIRLLKAQGALTESETITSMGQTLARLPVDVVVGKMLIMSCLFPDILDPIMSVSAGMCVQSIFNSRAHKDYDACKLRKSLESNHGDPLTMLSLLGGWLEMKEVAEETRRWCRKRGVEEQRLYEIIKLRMQFKQLLTDQGLYDDEEDEDDGEDEGGDGGRRGGVSDAMKRKQKHADRNQLRRLREERKRMDRKKKMLKMTEGHSSTTMNNDDDQDEGEKVVGDIEGDIRDLEFRLTNDMKRIHDVVINSKRVHATDTKLLKLLISSGLHPQLAIADEHNSFKPDSEQVYHTPYKSFVLLHPTSILSSDPDQLLMKNHQVKDAPKRSTSRHRGHLSSGHQLLSYVMLLETTKPYLINNTRVPALQTLLLLSNNIDLSADLHRLVFDSWLDVELDQSEKTCDVIEHVIIVRTAWKKLLDLKLKWSEEIQQRHQQQQHQQQQQHRVKKSRSRSERRSEKLLREMLLTELKKFTNDKDGISDGVFYRMRRLHIAEVNKLYRCVCTYQEMVEGVVGGVGGQVHPLKGGVEVTNYLTYDSLDDDGCYEKPEEEPEISDKPDIEFYSQPKPKGLEYVNKFDRSKWTCPICDISSFLNVVERLKHVEYCQDEKMAGIMDDHGKDAGGGGDDDGGDDDSSKKKYSCDSCGCQLKLTLAEIIRHRNQCNSKKNDAE